MRSTLTLTRRGALTGIGAAAIAAITAPAP